MAKKTVDKMILVKKKLPPVVYGLSGIMKVFDVSKSTAWKYRHGIIKDACTQQGNVIVVDVRKALVLFGVDEPDSMVSKEESK